MTAELQELLDIFPQDIRQILEQHPEKDKLIEVVLDLGRRPEARFPSGSEYLLETPVTQDQLDDCIERVGTFGGDNRAGIEQTLHRISAIRNRTGRIIGLTCRVGRAIYGTIGMIRDLVETGKSILMLGRPGVGKTTALREIARVLADDLNKRVVIIDTSNEIAGDGDIPHPAIGRARRMQVARPELQHQVMIEAVENHMPEVIVIDEIGTELEALASRTIAERGVQLVGTAHGNEIENLIKNPTLSDLVGGIQSVTLGDEEARRRRTQKTVLERKAAPTFEIAVEMLERKRWVVHESVADTVDTLLRGHQPNPEVRTLNEQGQVSITRKTPNITKPTVSAPPFSTQPSRRTSAQVLPFRSWSDQNLIVSEIEHQRSPDRELLAEEELSDISPPPKRIYNYGISRQQLENIIEELNLPILLVKDVENADAILVLRSHQRKHSNFRRMAYDSQLPIYIVKGNTTSSITRALRQALEVEEPDTGEEVEEFYPARNPRDEIDALEEARIAIEQIVIPKRQAVELLPRSSSIRKIQHELVERYRLKSHSLGDEPNRRLRIYPS